MARTAAEMVAEAKKRVHNLRREETAAEMGRGDALLIELRGPGERVQGRAIPGAVEAPRGMPEFWAGLRRATCSPRR